MGLRHFFTSCFSGDNKPLAEKEQQSGEIERPHSKECRVHNALNPTETGYIDEDRLRNALENIFPVESYGTLDFGIRVCLMRSKYQMRYSLH